MRWLRKYFALTPAARAIILRSLLLLPAVALLLRARGMARTAAVLERRKQCAKYDLPAIAPHEIARLVSAAASFLGVHCLSRSLVLWHQLRVSGRSPEVHLGVSKLADGSLSAHAWVELNGIPLIDSIDISERYAALPSPRGRLRIEHALGLPY